MKVTVPSRTPFTSPAVVFVWPPLSRFLCVPFSVGINRSPYNRFPVADASPVVEFSAPRLVKTPVVVSKVPNPRSTAAWLPAAALTVTPFAPAVSERTRELPKEERETVRLDPAAEAAPLIRSITFWTVLSSLCMSTAMEIPSVSVIVKSVTDVPL